MPSVQQDVEDDDLVAQLEGQPSTRELVLDLMRQVHQLESMLRTIMSALPAYPPPQIPLQPPNYPLPGTTWTNPQYTYGDHTNTSQTRSRQPVVS